eukprot:m.437162 g.437162  ORF g.437162 m.437162 type:complete len:208 (-) comp18071_c0_seq1:131-754(-)
MLCWVLGFATAVGVVAGTELTFEMGPHEEQCFHELIEESQLVTVEYQVIYGGHMDIDVEVKMYPHNGGAEVLFHEAKSETGSHTFNAKQTGEFTFCFSNAMSTVAHKTVYVDVVVGNDDPLTADAQKHHQTFTQVETSLINNHDALRRVIDLQTHHRMREANHRYTAEFMNERVQLVSAAEALMLVILSICQIVYLKSLFAARPNKW